MHMRNRESDPSIFHRDKEQKEPLNKRYQVCRSCREFPGQSKAQVICLVLRPIVKGYRLAKKKKLAKEFE